MCQIWHCPRHWKNNKSNKKRFFLQHEMKFGFNYGIVGLGWKRIPCVAANQFHNMNKLNITQCSLFCIYTLFPYYFAWISFCVVCSLFICSQFRILSKLKYAVKCIDMWGVLVFLWLNPKAKKNTRRKQRYTNGWIKEITMMKRKKTKMLRNKRNDKKLIHIINN